MGGNKSKPVVQSARQVLAKRGVAPPATASGAIPQKNVVPSVAIDLGIDIDLKYDPKVVEDSSSKARINDLNTDIDDNIRDQIAKWPMVKSTTVDAQRLDKLAAAAASLNDTSSPDNPRAVSLLKDDDVIPSASLIRMNQEKSVDEVRRSSLDSASYIPEGRLTEYQLLTLFKRIREAPAEVHSYEQIADEFGVSLATIELLTKTAKYPMVKVDEESLELSLVR